MVLALGILGGLLIVWGLFVLVTGDFVATLDIAASLIASGSLVVGLAVIARSLERIAMHLAAEPLVAAEAEEAMADWQEPALAEESPVEASPVEAAYRNAAAPSVEAAAEETAPTLVREGVIEGRNFRFYSDGSIEAEGPNGIRRFKSIDEAREFILRERGQAENSQSAPSAAPSSPQPTSQSQPASPPPSTPDTPPEPPRAPRAVVDIPPPEGRNNPSAGTTPRPARPTVTWDTYLAGGREAATASSAVSPAPAVRPAEPSAPTPSEATPDDEQWSEPFRMLLRGGQSGPLSNDKTPGKD